MARRTRQSRAKIVTDHTKVSSNEDQPALQGVTGINTTLQYTANGQSQTISLNQREGGKKRTSSYNTTNSPNPATKAAAAAHKARSKKARKPGTVSDSQDIALVPEGEGEREQGHVDSVVVAKAKRQKLQRTSSFYPDRGDPVHALTASIKNNVTDDQSDVESMTDWFMPLDDLDMEEPAPRRASKFSEAVVVERPSWQGSAASAITLGGSVSEPMQPSSQGQADDADTSQEDDGSGVIDTTLAPELPNSPWPAETNIVLLPGTNRMMLMNQRPLIRLIIQDAMDKVRADLLFRHAFPDPAVALSTIRDSLLTSAAHYPSASSIYRRLLFDEAYMTAIVPLPRARVPLFRSEVKERCATIVSMEFSSIGSVDRIKSAALKQLSRYNYTFPTAPSGSSNTRLLMRTRPYRNERIITAIRDLYFMGGLASFACWFAPLFPTHQGLDGVTTREVPIPMVALVATGLYAAIYEWRTGVHQPMGFSANAYLDVYLGHVNTFDHIREQRSNTFHIMMADIYTQTNPVTECSAVPIAELPLEDLDG